MNRLTEINVDHLRRMTDCTGIIQHATYSIPNKETGYTTDDNARALITALKLKNHGMESLSNELAHRYLSFLMYVQHSDGTFHNYINYARMLENEEPSEDAFGRAVWALGYTTYAVPNSDMALVSWEMLQKALPNTLKLRSLRGNAFTIIGLSYLIKAYPTEVWLQQLLTQLTTRIIAMYESTSCKEWQWPEPQLTYCNAIIPMALILASDVAQNKDWLAVGEQCLDFLTNVYWRKRYFKLVGNDGWYGINGKFPEFDEQPVDAGALVQAYSTAYLVTRNNDYLDKLVAAREWFYGRNFADIVMYNSETGGCYDGITPSGPNLNQGAEALLSWLLAELSFRECMEIRTNAAA